MVFAAERNKSKASLWRESGTSACGTDQTKNSAENDVCCKGLSRHGLMPTRRGTPTPSIDEVCRIISGTVFPAFLSFLTFWIVSEIRRGLRPKSDAALVSLLDAVHLPLAANVVLELGDEREDAHHKPARARAGVDCRIIEHLEVNSFLGEL